MVLPWVFYQEILEDEDMGDLEFIQEKVLAGDYFQVSGDINALNDTIEFVVPNARTAFLLEAKTVITTHADPPAIPDGATSTVNDRVRAVLKIDTVIKDTTNIGVIMSQSSSGGGTDHGGGLGHGDLGDGRFNVLGLSLVGDNAKKIEIENTLDNGSAFATMSGYLV